MADMPGVAISALHSVCRHTWRPSVQHSIASLYACLEMEILESHVKELAIYTVGMHSLTVDHRLTGNALHCHWFSQSPPTSGMPAATI